MIWGFGKKRKLSDIQKTESYESTKKCSSCSGSGRSRCTGCGGSGVRGYGKFCMSCGVLEDKYVQNAVEAVKSNK